MDRSRPSTNLTERSDERKRRRRERERRIRELTWPVELATPVVLTDRATSVTAANPHEIPAEWWPVIDREWCHRQLGLARRWHERGRRARRAARAAERLNDAWRLELAQLGDERGPAQPVADELAPTKRARYADARARTIALERSAVVAQCGQRTIQKRCACGPSSAPVGCGQVLLCDTCRRPYYRRIRRRALAAVVARLADATTSWARGGRRRGQRPQIVLVTLTIPRHLDGAPLSLMDRRHRLVDGWRKLRQWLHRRIGQFPFVALPELTAGSDGSGHLHYHVLCVWPWWRWQDAQAEWRRATGLPDANPPDMRVVRNPKVAAHYVAKYATKGVNVDGNGMTPELIADFVATFYGKRRITPSVGWWVRMDPPCCPKCAGQIVVTERPVPVIEAAACWRARRGIAGIPEALQPAPDRTWLQCAPAW